MVNIYDFIDPNGDIVVYNEKLTFTSNTYIHQITGLIYFKNGISNI